MLNTEMEPMKTKTKCKNTGGRPAKVSLETKLLLVDNYYLFEAHCDSEKMSVHNIYSLLSEYAMKEKGLDLKPYDFSRSHQIKEHIVDLCAQSDNQPCKKTGLPVYKPLVIEALTSMPQDKMKKILTERENYVLTVHSQASMAIEQQIRANTQVSSLKKQIEEISQRCQKLQQDNDELIQCNSEITKRNTRLSSYIRKYVDPALAESALKGKLAKELTSEANAIICCANSEPADVNIKKFMDNSSNPDVSCTKSILSLFNNEEDN